MEFIPFKENETLMYKFFQVPQDLIYNELYKNKLNSDSILLYAFLLDRLSLSLKNHWYDKNGDVYLIYTRQEFGDALHLSDKTVTKAFNQLKDLKLIAEKRQGLGKANLIYLGKIQHPDSDREKVHFLNRR